LRRIFIFLIIIIISSSVGSVVVYYNTFLLSLEASEANITIVIPRGASQPPEGWTGGLVFDSKYFEPPTLRIIIGVNNTVRWVNLDDLAHTVTSLETPRSVSFDSGLISPGASFVVKFNVEGHYTYYCQVHPWAGGIVIVENKK